MHGRPAAALGVSPRFFPPLSRERLRPRHFLAVHDSLVKLRPDGHVRAFIKEREEFHVDILWQLPNYKGPAELVDLFPRISGALGSRGTLHHEGHRLGLEFSDGVVLCVTIGNPDWKVEDLNKEPTEDRRQVLRAGLGYDFDEWERRLPGDVRMAANDCLEWAASRMMPEAIAPVIVWQTWCLDRLEKAPKEAFGGMFKRLAMDVQQTYYMDGSQLWNPLIPEEDLLTIDRCRNMMGMFAEDSTLVGKIGAYFKRF